MLQRVAEVITRYNMFAPGARIGVAVSGGADSVCLFHLLTELARDWNLALTALHLDHGLRGEESRADAAFVRTLAVQLGWPALTSEAHLGANPEARENLEQSAREARHAFFQNAMRDAQLVCVATGHTRDDQAETVVFRFLRGSGTAGLAGIRPVTIGDRAPLQPPGNAASLPERNPTLKLVRPLIETSRADIEAWLGARGYSWREDSSNSNQPFARNRIRRELLPWLEREWNPALRQTLFQTAEWARAEEEYWRGEVGRLAAACLTEGDGFVFTTVAQLARLPLAAARRMVRHAMKLVKGDLRGVEFLHVESILAMAAATEGHGRVQAAGVDVFRSFDRLRFGPIGADRLADRNYRVPAAIPGVAGAPLAGIEIVLELFDQPPPGNSGDGVWLDADLLSDSLVLRNWRPGDRYRAAGRADTEKIKSLFQEFRVPLWERGHWPVLLDGENIVWARQFGACADCAATAGSRRLLRVSDKRPNAPLHLDHYAQLDR